MNQPRHRENEHFRLLLVHDEGFALEILKDNWHHDGGNRLKMSATGTTLWGLTSIDGATGGRLSYEVNMNPPLGHYQ